MPKPSRGRGNRRPPEPGEQSPPDMGIPDVAKYLGVNEWTVGCAVHKSWSRSRANS